MKLQIIIVFALVLSVNTFAQATIEKPFEYKYESLNHLKGRVVVMYIVDVRDSNDIEKFDGLIEKYKNEKVTFILITDKIDESTYNLIKNNFSHYKCLSVRENEKVFNTYQTSMYKTFPIQILLNKKGKAIYVKKGNVNNIERKLIKRIDRLMNKI